MPHSTSGKFSGHRIIKETHLPISFGLSTSKTVAEVGTGETKSFYGIW